MLTHPSNRLASMADMHIYSFSVLLPAFFMVYPPTRSTNTPEMDGATPCQNSPDSSLLALQSTSYQLLETEPQLGKAPPSSMSLLLLLMLFIFTSEVFWLGYLRDFT